MVSKNDVTAIHKKTDYQGLLATAIMGYAPHLALMTALLGTAGIIRHGVVVAATMLAVQVPYLREIPLLVSRLFMRAFVVKGVKEASPRVSALFNEVARAADMKNLQIYEYERGARRNAVAFSDSVYVGKDLVEVLDDRELKAIIAHEVAHHKARDIVPGVMMWFPYWGALLTFATTGMQAIQSPSVTMAFGTAAAYGYYKYQQAVRSYGARILEYRADRNAVNFTRDPLGMIRAQVLLFNDDNIAAAMNEHSLSYKFGKLFKMHPDIFARVAAVQAHGAQLEDAGLLPRHPSRGDGHTQQPLMSGVIKQP